MSKRKKSYDSCFAVEIDFKTIEGNNFHIKFPEKDLFGECMADLHCSATQVADVKDIDELFELLKDSLDLGIEEDEDSKKSYFDLLKDNEAFEKQYISEHFDENGNVIKEDIDDSYLIEFFKKRIASNNLTTVCESYESFETPAEKETRRVKEVMDEMKDSIQILSNIQSIEFRRIWKGTRDYSNSFDYIKEDYPEFYSLAKNVVDTVGEEKEEVKEKFKAFMIDNPDFVVSMSMEESCPDGFMGSIAGCTVRWDAHYDSIEEFAQDILDECVPIIGDYAISTTRIDFEGDQRKIDEKAEYIGIHIDYDD